MALPAASLAVVTVKSMAAPARYLPWDMSTLVPSADQVFVQPSESLTTFQAKLVWSIGSEKFRTRSCVRLAPTVPATGADEFFDHAATLLNKIVDIDEFDGDYHRFLYSAAKKNTSRAAVEQFIANYDREIVQMIELLNTGRAAEAQARGTIRESASTFSPATSISNFIKSETR